MTPRDDDSGSESGVETASGGANDSPHLLADSTPDTERAYWAETVADAIDARNPDQPIVIKGGVSPSGVSHLGNFNEIMRGYLVAQVLRDRGHDVRQVFTSDDRDPLRKVPRTLADSDGSLVDLGDVDAESLGRSLGMAYTDIPDPFGDAPSYAAHFASLLKSDAERLDVPVEMISTTDLYENGTFDPILDRVLGDAEQARDVIAPYQDTVDESYVPFNAICSECGQLTDTVTAVDPDTRTVEYQCTGMDAGGRTIDGCGHEGTAGFREGKLPWRFEWPAEWAVLGVDFEPFGKDHAEGSWPSGVDIAHNVVDVEPPVPTVYEWFTLNGEPLSSSAGNVITVQQLLELLEPEVVRYFFARNPKKARDLDISRLDQLVDEFDRFERAFFDETGDEHLEPFAQAAYPHVVDEVRKGRVRLPYTFAAVLGMVDDRELQVRLARSEGHITADTPQWAIDDALDRIERARSWARQMDNAYNYELQAELPEVEFTEATTAALDDLAEFVATGHDGEAIQSEIYDTAREHDLNVGDFFEAGYRLFFDDTAGPRLGEFLGDLEREFVVTRLRREG